MNAIEKYGIDQCERAFKLFEQYNSAEKAAEEMGCSVGDVFQMMRPVMGRMQEEINEQVKPIIREKRHLSDCPKLECTGKVHPPKEGEQLFVCDTCSAIDSMASERSAMVGTANLVRLVAINWVRKTKPDKPKYGSDGGSICHCFVKQIEHWENEMDLKE